MSQNNSKNNYCFSAIFDSSDTYENYPDKKGVQRKHFDCCLKSMRDRTWNYCLKIVPWFI